jgi:hypothetical protein
MQIDASNPSLSRQRQERGGLSKFNTDSVGGPSLQ